MLTKAASYLQYLIWYQPVDVLAGIAVLCAAGVVAGTGTSVLVRGWRRTRAVAADGLIPSLVLLLFCLGDYALLCLLPRVRLSFSTQIVAPLLASTMVRLGLLWAMLFSSMVVRLRARRTGIPARARGLFITFLVLNAAFSVAQVDAYVLEPLLVETTELSLASADLDPDAPPVRVVHLTDTHIERSSYREANVVQRVNALEPDIVVLTGDYLNLSRLDDPVSAEHWRQFVSQLHAPYGTYAVRGSVEPDLASMAWLVEGTEVTWLEQESVTVDVRGQAVTLAGVACSHRHAEDSARLDRALSGVSADAFTLLLYHSPDLIVQAAEHEVDLYLTGHTHGGQLRLPFYGAIVTGSMYGKAYEAGLYSEGATSMYVSRGIGFEGGGMPRARFLCRPEIASLELRGAR